MNISIFTATGHYNIGDELILLQEYQFFKEYFKNAKFSIFTYDKNSCLIEDNVEYIEYFPSDIKKRPFSNLKYLWKNIITIFKSEIIIIGGGGLIYEEEVQSSSSPIMQWKFRVFLAKLFRKKIVYFAIGINTKNLKKIKYLFSGKNTLISVRDEKSSLTLDKIGIKNIIIDDPVFSLEPEKKLIKTEKIIGISLRKGYLKDEIENIKQMILFLSKKGYKIVFLSHSIHQKDELANDYLFLKDIAKKYNIEITKDIKKTLKYYRSLDFVIGMRFHSLILSLVYNIPFIAFSYSQKTDELLKYFNFEYKIDPKNFMFADFVKMFEDLEKKAPKFDFNEKISTIKSDLKTNIFNYLKNGLE